MNIGNRGKTAALSLLAVGLVAVTLVLASMALGGPGRLTGERSVKASKPLFEPGVGVTNVYCSGGLVPASPFTQNGCQPAATEGTFQGSFQQGTHGNEGKDEHAIEPSTGSGAKADFTATFLNPIDGKEYRIVSRDTTWNSSTTREPTPNTFFAKPYGNVFFDQPQHGQTMIDRSDAPLIYSRIGVYGHVDVWQGDRQVARDIFVHVMVGPVLAPAGSTDAEFLSHYKITPTTPNLVFIFVVNTPGTIKATPPPTDPSISHGPMGDTDDRSSPWPTDDPSQPLYFNFLIYQEVALTIPGGQ